MPINRSAREIVVLILRYIAAYALWLLVCGLSVGIFIAARNAWLALLPVVGWQAMAGIDRLGVLVGGLVMLIAILFFEHYLRTAVEQNRLLARTLRVATPQVVMLLIFFAIPPLIGMLR